MSTTQDITDGHNDPNKFNMLHPPAEGLGDDFAFPDEFLQDFLPVYDLQNLGDYADLGLDDSFLGDVSYVDFASNKQDYSEFRQSFGPSCTLLNFAQTWPMWQM